jgi:hypothetical protein
MVIVIEDDGSQPEEVVDPAEIERVTFAIRQDSEEFRRLVEEAEYAVQLIEQNADHSTIRAAIDRCGQLRTAANNSHDRTAKLLAEEDRALGRRGLHPEAIEVAISESNLRRQELTDRHKIATSRLKCSPSRRSFIGPAQFSLGLIPELRRCSRLRTRRGQPV